MGFRTIEHVPRMMGIDLDLVVFPCISSVQSIAQQLVLTNSLFKQMCVDHTNQAAEAHHLTQSLDFNKLEVTLHHNIWSPNPKPLNSTPHQI